MHVPTLNLNELLKSRFRTHGNKVALNFGEEKVRYSQLIGESNKIAHALINHGVQRNTRVAMFMSNRKEYVVTELGIFFSGGTKVALNTMLGEQDIRYILQDSEAEILFVENRFLDIIENIMDDLPCLRVVVGLDDSTSEISSFTTWEDFQHDFPTTDPKVYTEKSDMSLILYTGGTTGNPKGVVHTREGTCLTMISIALDANIREDERILLTTPLPHAAMLYLYAGFIMGAQAFIEDKFDLEVVANHIEKNKITFLSLVPTIIYRLIDYMEEKEIDVSSIRTIQYGTAPITAARLKQGLELFGPVFTQIYGLSETQSAATWLRKEDHRLDGDTNLLRSCGKPAVFSQVKVVDENGKEVSRGEEGEITVKALTNLVEYLNLPEKTAETIRDGWLFTGDIGRMDENGYLYLLDRKKDMIISGGMNVYSTEVENVIQKHSSVKQVAVIGVPDDDWGEAVHAFIIAKDDSTLEELALYCKQNLSKYKVPKAIRLVDTLPLTSYGKIDKKTLREPFWRAKERQI